MENKTGDIILSHPVKTRAIAEARIKTDKIRTPNALYEDKKVVVLYQNEGETVSL